MSKKNKEKLAIQMLIDLNLDYERPIIINGIMTEYTININGDVYSYKGYKTDKPRKLIPVKMDNGYYKVNLMINGKEKLYSIHRLVASAFIPNPENKPEVNHKNGDKSANFIYNLEWSTSKENIDHAVMTGLKTFKKGQDHPMAKINAGVVIQICEFLQSGKYNYTEISKITGVSYNVIKKIKNRYRWRDISCSYDFSNYNKNRKDDKYE